MAKYKWASETQETCQHQSSFNANLFCCLFSFKRYLDTGCTSKYWSGLQNKINPELTKTPCMWTYNILECIQLYFCLEPRFPAVGLIYMDTSRIHIVCIHNLILLPGHFWLSISLLYWIDVVHVNVTCHQSFYHQYFYFWVTAKCILHWVYFE